MVQGGWTGRGYTLSRTSKPVADGRWQDGYERVARSREGRKRALVGGWMGKGSLGTPGMMGWMLASVCGDATGWDSTEGRMGWKDDRPTPRVLTALLRC